MRSGNIFLLKTVRCFHFSPISSIFHLQTQAFWYKYVDSCPKDKEEWEKRANALDCLMDLFETLKRMYHCALTGEGDRLVEVCAPSVHIHGTYNHPYHTPIHFRPQSNVR